MESKKKMLFIFNPFSGKAQIKSKLFEIIDVFVKGGYEVIVHPTQAVQNGAILPDHHQMVSKRQRSLRRRWISLSAAGATEHWMKLSAV